MDDKGFRQRVIQMIDLAITESDRCLGGLSTREIEVHRDTVLLDELLEEVKSARTDRERYRALEKRIVAEGLHAAVMIRNIVAGLDQLGGPENIDSWNLSEAMYRLGFAHALLIQFELRLDSDYRAMFHAIRSAEIVGNNRWAEDREDYNSAIQEAENYWRGGGTDLHHVIARRLAKSYRVNENTLKARLAPVARQYGRCFGMKGSRKRP